MYGTNKNSVELLAPAGSIDHIRRAIKAGADAVYIGIQGMSARPETWEFDLSDAIKAVRIAHKVGISIYFALNAEYSEAQASTLGDYLKQIENSGCDALIIADWGLLKSIKNMGFKIPVHASTLLGVYNIASIQLLEKMGIKRVILNTNLFLDEIAAMIKACPKMEFEIIVYGGLCFNDNRRCSLPHMTINGNYFVGCQYDYIIKNLQNNMESKPTNIHMPEIDLSSTLALYISIGITAFKIEGRTRSKNYISKATTNLRKTIDNLMKQPQITRLNHYVIHPGDIGIY